MLLFLDALLALLATLFLVYLTVVCVLSLLPCPQRSPGGAARAQWAARGGSCGARAAVYTLALKAASGVATGAAYLLLLCSAPELHDFPLPCSRSRGQIALWKFGIRGLLSPEWEGMSCAGSKSPLVLKSTRICPPIIQRRPKSVPYAFHIYLFWKKREKLIFKSTHIPSLFF